MDERERWKWGVLVMLAPGLVVSAGIAVWMYLNIGLLSFLLDVLATCAAVALIGKMWSGVYWGIKGPHPIYESDKKRVAALVDHDGQVEVMPLPPYPASLTSLTTHYDPRINAPQVPAIAAPVIEASPALPTAKSIYELAPAMHNADKVLLGYDEQGPIWLEIEDLLSIAMAGNSGRGKSRALLWLIAQFLRLQLDTRIIDGKADLRKWLGAYHPVAYTPPEIKQMVDATIAEIERRLDEDSQGMGTEFPPVLVVLDELDLITGRYGRVTHLVELLTKKSRSVNVHGVYSNQSIPAGLVGGIKNRGVIVSRICFYCDDEAAQLLGVRGRNGGVDLLQRIGPPAPQGLALVRTAIFGWKVIAFPFVADEGIPFLLGAHALPPMPMKQPVSPPPASVPEIAPESPQVGGGGKRQLVDKTERHEILELAAQGLSPAGIAAAMHRRNAFADIVRVVLEEEESL